jgi:hypothetical protein
MFDTAIKKEILSHFKYPCFYADGGQMIFDSNNQMMVDVRAWGMIQYIKSENKPEDLQDALGEFIAESINKHWKEILSC